MDSGEYDVYEDPAEWEPTSGEGAVGEVGNTGMWNTGANGFKVEVSAAEVAGMRVTALVVKGDDSPTALVGGGPTTSAEAYV